MTNHTDRIERSIRIAAPRSRVWRALTNAQEFGAWFGVKLSGGTFVPGAHVHGNITHPGYTHLVWNVWIEKVEPERRFSWRWHPAAVEVDKDYSKEPTTLVEFTLEEVQGGTILKVVESGFDKVPPERRLDAFRMNNEGWEAQMGNIERYAATK
jgi:uncharacterized protein YndB with AHSA1/START domain